MARDIGKIELGPAIVEFGTGQDVISFETTIGGVNFTIETQYREQTIDQLGETVVKKNIIGRNASVTVPFAEKDLEVIPKVVAGSELVEDGTGKKVLIRTGVGIDLLEIADKVVIKPVGYENDASKWVTLPLAYPEADLNYSYDNDNERITNITFTSTPDADGVIAILGDEEVTAV